MEHNPVLKNPLSLDSEIPLYSQLMGIIKREPRRAQGRL